MRARSWSVTAAVAAAALALSGPVLGAAASVPHEVVVEQVPAADVAQLESSDRVLRPRVDALASHRGLTFVGGVFDRLVDTAGTHRRHNIAVLASDTGQVLEKPLLRVNGDVLALATRGRYLYRGGTFTKIDGRPRSYLAKVEAATGELVRDFRPSLDGPVKEVATAGKRVFVAGAFS